MVEVNHFYPIAQWLESQEVASDLVINLSDPSDEKIYICEYDEVRFPRRESIVLLRSPSTLI